jgi:molybdopterin/thiamine biosynthesis adenylyltransferase
MPLDDRELERYSPQTILPEIGIEGQEKLKQASVLCIGAGGLGSPLCLYLAAAGIGTLGIVDDDQVTLSNLQRQILYKQADAGALKVKSAATHLQALNSQCEIRQHVTFLSSKNAISIIQDYDIVVDCSDNFITRYIINDACCALNKANVFAAILQFQGYCTVFPGKGGPCYRCWFDAPPRQSFMTCAEAGILGTVAGLLGVWQANEVIKLILGIGRVLIGRVMVLDALNGETRFINLLPQSDCLTCHPASRELSSLDQ